MARRRGAGGGGGRAAKGKSGTARRSAGWQAAFRRWEQLHERPPTLYHYTTAAGLISMVKSGHVWATESRYMNDTREFIHGAELILDVVEKARKRTPHPVLEELHASVARHVEEQLQNVRIFCVSFCTDGDLLSQWRGYGDLGGGYALGFRPELLLGAGIYERGPFRVLRRVVYEEGEQRRLVEDCLRAAVQHVGAGADSAFWQFFSEAIISFKDVAYTEEGEWRLVQFGRALQGGEVLWKHPVEFRDRKGKVVPYADLDLSGSRGPYAGKLPIREIVHGPTQDPERSGKAIRILLDGGGYTEDQVTLRHSIVPFAG
jgi:hypothetical protein